MLGFINANYKAGDTIEVTCSEGNICGQIKFVDNNVIVLLLPNGRICGIAASDIRTFCADAPIPMQAVPGYELNAPAEAEEPEAAESESHSEAEEAPIAIAGHITEEVKETEVDGVKELSIGKGEEGEPSIKCKVVGKIPLDQLRRMDPRSKQRVYFNNSSSADKYATTADDNESTHDDIFVSALGRITYYNSEKRYGFIHDFNTDYDLYFHQSQVADHQLYDHLTRGTKVAYTLSENQQGHVALCVHLPHSVDELLEMADHYIGKRMYNLAEGLVDHVLAVDAKNADALELQSEIKGLRPYEPTYRRNNNHNSYNNTSATGYATSASQYNPDTLYTKAKRAFLAKDLETAEEFYRKAIEAGERPESSVKDLLTTFVMKFKMAATEDERKAVSQKADEVYELYKHHLPDNLTTKQFLALNYYLPLLKYEEFIEVTNDLMEQPEIAGNKTKVVFFLWQQAMVKQKQGKLDEALALADKGLGIWPYHSQLVNFRYYLEHPEPAVADEAADEKAEAAPEAAEESAPAAADEKAEETKTSTSETGTPMSDDWWNSLSDPRSSI